MVMKVVGLDRETGEPMTRVYEAETQREATDRAYADGMVVERVERVRVAKPASGATADYSMGPTLKNIGASLRSLRREKQDEHAQPVLIKIDSSAFATLALAIGVGIALGSVFTIVLWVLLFASLVGYGASQGP